MFLIFHGYTKIIFIIYIYIYIHNLEIIKIKRRTGARFIFQTLVHVLQRVSLDRKGSREPCRCPCNPHWLESGAQKGGPRKY